MPGKMLMLKWSSNVAAMPQHCAGGVAVVVFE
jgi:hypothetical protein